MTSLVRWSRPASSKTPRRRAIRVFLVCDNPSLGAGMQVLVNGREGLEVVGEARSRAAALAAMSRQRPDVVVLDIDGGDLDLVRELCGAAGPASRLLVVTGASDPALHYRVLRGGAMGIVPKDELVESLPAAIREVCGGRAWLDGAMMARVLDRMDSDEGSRANEAGVDDTSLTRREREIVTLVSQGLGNRRVAERLFLSEGTVRNHMTVIFRKLGLADRCDLIAHWAGRRGGAPGRGTPLRPP